MQRVGCEVSIAFLLCEADRAKAVDAKFLLKHDRSAGWLRDYSAAFLFVVGIAPISLRRRDAPEPLEFYWG